MYEGGPNSLRGVQIHYAWRDSLGHFRSDPFVKSGALAVAVPVLYKKETRHPDLCPILLRGYCIIIRGSETVECPKRDPLKSRWARKC